MATSDPIVVELSREQLHAIIGALQGEHRRATHHREHCQKLADDAASRGDDAAAQEMRDCATVWEERAAEMAAVIPSLPEWVASTWPTMIAEHRSAVPA